MRSLACFALALPLLALPLFPQAFAEEPMCEPESQWEKLLPEAENYASQGDFLTSAAHNPRVKDYYRASEMYAKAATLYEQGKYLFLNASTRCIDTPETYQAQQKTLGEQAKKYIFKSFQANRVGSNRASRGLL